jgi:PilZ domain
MTQPFAVQRAENRVEMKVTALLIGRHGRLGVERAVTENVSPRGIRVISSSEWYVDDTILVSLPAGHYTSAARVAYCDASGKDRFVTGLEFVGTNEQLQLSNIDVANEY